MQSIDQKALIRTRVSELYLQGLDQYAIAAELSKEFRPPGAKPYTQQAVSMHVKRIREEWRTRRLDAYEAKIDRELAKLDQIERDAWRQWRKSIGKSVVVTERNTTDGLETTTRTEHLVGDPRFLQIVGNCVTKRCEILGLNAPTRTQVEVTAESLEVRAQAARRRLQLVRPQLTAGESA